MSVVDLAYVASITSAGGYVGASGALELVEIGSVVEPLVAIAGLVAIATIMLHISMKDVGVRIEGDR